MSEQQIGSLPLWKVTGEVKVDQGGTGNTPIRWVNEKCIVAAKNFDAAVRLAPDALMWLHSKRSLDARVRSIGPHIDSVGEQVSARFGQGPDDD
jgi:hypothetical protein